MEKRSSYDRRSFGDRRAFDYAAYVPERRDSQRRSGKDRRDAQ